MHLTTGIVTSDQPTQRRCGRQSPQWSGLALDALELNHTHLKELLMERERIEMSCFKVRRILVKAGVNSPRPVTSPCRCRTRSCTRTGPWCRHL